DISPEVKNVPTLHGSGPFAASPKFAAVGSPATLVNINLPASSNLFIRKGSLVSLNGNLKDITSTLSLLNPVTRGLTATPTLYTKITSLSSVNILLGSRSSAFDTFTVLSLDGRADWKVTQKSGVYAWSGPSLSVSTKLDSKMNFANWATTLLSGRGQVALLAKGQVYQIKVEEGESIAINPRSLLAYSTT
ncbi:hypothetical protein CANCADRAFT_15129, partial [Tortispora caseinolytica NRRL Y-17796]